MKFALDTNIFIASFRDAEAEAELLAFLERALPFTFLSAVVMQELSAGARTAKAARALQTSVFLPFERRGRVFAPSPAAFVASGRMFAAISGDTGRPARVKDPSLLNDALIAASCRERGISLVTNDADFKRFEPFLRGWRHFRPWPDVTQRTQRGTVSIPRA